jgi:hypothetical protein
MVKMLTSRVPGVIPGAIPGAIPGVRGTTLKRAKFLALILPVFSISACSSLGVEPWERDVLSAPDMQFNPAGTSSTLSQHFYFSKEASSGGQGFAGGGCGCN